MFLEWAWLSGTCPAQPDSIIRGMKLKTTLWILRKSSPWQYEMSVESCSQILDCGSSHCFCESPLSLMTGLMLQLKATLYEVIWSQNWGVLLDHLPPSNSFSLKIPAFSVTQTEQWTSARLTVMDLCFAFLEIKLVILKNNFYINGLKTILVLYN